MVRNLVQRQFPDVAKKNLTRGYVNLVIEVKKEEGKKASNCCSRTYGTRHGSNGPNICRRR